MRDQNPAPSAPEIDNDRLCRLIDAVRETRILFGLAAARFMWSILGLPLAPATQRANDKAATGALDYVSVVRRFLNERCAEDLRCETQAVDLYDEFSRWAIVSNQPPMTKVRLARVMVGLGFARRKSGTWIYLGLRIRSDA